MRRKKLKAYRARLKELQKRGKLTRDELLLAIGAAKEKAGRNAHRLVILHLPGSGEQTTADTFRIELDREKLISFLAYCLHVTLEKYNKKAAPGLTADDDPKKKAAREGRLFSLGERDQSLHFMRKLRRLGSPEPEGNGMSHGGERRRTECPQQQGGRAFCPESKKYIFTRFPGGLKIP